MKNTHFKLIAGFYILSIIFVFVNSSEAQKKTSKYAGKAYHDSLYKSGSQIIPGKLQCEYYDLGGEGIAFHDLDSTNSGSGQLNRPNGTYLNAFRINEPVDISYTKFRDPAIDNSKYNFVEPQKDQLYVGWTKTGEWTKYTVKVEQSGNYQLGLMFTSNKNGKIAFAVNDKLVTEPITIPSTFVAEDNVAWRQWHHWNYLENIAKIYLKKGIQTITLHTVELGDMNYDFVNFKRVD